MVDPSEEPFTAIQTMRDEIDREFLKQNPSFESVYTKNSDHFYPLERTHFEKTFL